MQSFVDAFKALGAESRLKIVEMLQEGKLPVSEIVRRCGLSQPTISHHLKILKQAGIVVENRDGKWIYHDLNLGIFAHLRIFIRDLEKGGGYANDAVNRSHGTHG